MRKTISLLQSDILVRKKPIRKMACSRGQGSILKKIYFIHYGGIFLFSLHITKFIETLLLINDLFFTNYR